MAKIKTSFSGHDKFDCKIDWITKGLEAYQKDNSIFAQSNIETTISQLGLGSNMIKSLNHWLKGFDLIDEEGLTRLGEIILSCDPYLENSDTLWLLHWNLVKYNKKNTLYHLFFNKMYPYKFSKNDIIEYISSWLNMNEIKLSPTTLNSDADVFIRMYSNDKSDNMSLLSELNIITRTSQSNFTLNMNAVTDISDELFLYILCDYIEMQYTKNITTISIDDIQRGTLSIQKSLCLSENMLYNKINKLSKLTDNNFKYSETAGMRQIYITTPINKSDILTKIYN